MSKTNLSFFIVFYLILFSLTNLLAGDTTNSKSNKISDLRKDAPKIFIDCNDCDLDYIKTNIGFVNYVIDTKEAEVYILITEQNTGSGGQVFTLEFTGQKSFKGIIDKLTCITNQDDTSDKIREKLVKTLKLGLIPYINKTPLAEMITISFEKELKPIIKKDKWNNWIFNIYINSFFNGETSYKSNYLNLSLSAERVTEKNKIEIYARTSSNKSEFDLGEDGIITSKNTNHSFRTNYIHGINKHWSIGSFLRTYSSTYNNKNLAIRPSIGIEYNIFPYSESTKKQFRFQYQIGIEKVKYEVTTIYDKDKESLFFQELSTALELKQKWGTVNMSVSGFNYFHDFSKYSINIHSRVSWRIVKGLSVNVRGGYSIIHDQLYLPKGDLTPEEILLRVSALATSYDYWGSIGFQITFGSIYNVNPRFGN